MATATIPETVTMPGQIVYDALVRLSAAEELLLRIAGYSSSPLQEELAAAQAALFGAAFRVSYGEDDVSSAAFVKQVDAEGWELLASSLGLKEAVSA